MTDCLNWVEDDIRREESVTHVGFVDYVLRKGNATILVIEAKKEGIAFELPPNYKNRRYKIAGIISESKPLIEAIEQAQAYCTAKGTRVGVISNGFQFVAFEAFRPGGDWREGTCVVFNGFDDIERNFGDFFKHFNRESVRNGNLVRLISGEPEEVPFSRPLDGVIGRDATLTRNYLHTYIAPFIEFIFQDITAESQIDVLRRCYVYERAYKYSDEVMRQIFEDSIPHYARKDHIKLFKEGALTAGKFDHYISKGSYSQETGKLVLLLGGVGSGKTTFVHRYFNIVKGNEPTCVWFYVDFKQAPIDSDEIEEYIYQQVIDKFERVYEPKMHDQLEMLGITFNKENKPTYVGHCIRVLKHNGFIVHLVLDNVDRCSTNLQESIFLLAQNFISRFKVLTLLSLREETYYRFKQTGPFDAYHIPRFHIASPPFERLVTYRLNYLLMILGLTDDKIAKALSKPIIFDEKKPDVLTFLATVRRSLSSWPGYPMKPISNFLTCVSDGDMRAALDLFNNFLRSGNTKVEEILDKCDQGEKYRIAEYQFLKSVILGDSRYYRGDRSFIMNVFDPNIALTTSHFMHLRILRYAHLLRTNETDIGRGYVSINILARDAESVFLQEQVVLDSLRKLARFGLIRLDNESKDGLDTAVFYKLTARGQFYLNELSRRFIYLDLVQTDTQIGDEVIAEQLLEDVDTVFLPDRFRRCEQFINHLQKAEQYEHSANPQFKMSRLTNHEFMPTIIESFKTEKTTILNRMKRYGKL